MQIVSGLESCGQPDVSIGLLLHCPQQRSSAQRWAGGRPLGLPWLVDAIVILFQGSSLMAPVCPLPCSTSVNE